MKSKKIITLVCILLLFSIVLPLTSCNRNRDYDEAEVLLAAENLLRLVIPLNTVYFGGGINYLPERAGEGSYCEADPVHLSALGFSTVAALQEKTLAVYTDGCAENIFSTKLEAINVDGYIVEIARYYQATDPESGEPTVIMVNKNMKQVFDDRMTFDFSTLRVLGSEGERVNLEITVTVKDGDGNGKNMTLPVVLIEEAEGWRLDSLVLANYREES